eukprot:6093359-Alexandrium_andersonii.AAC.1
MSLSDARIVEGSSDFNAGFKRGGASQTWSALAPYACYESQFGARCSCFPRHLRFRPSTGTLQLATQRRGMLG